MIVDVRRLAELPPGATVILALPPSISDDDLDWLNLNRPVVSDLRLSVVLWCEDGAAASLARRAPDFFDWISARVDCPSAPAAHAVADVKRAIRARASGIAWDGPGLEETLAAVRPSRPLRRVTVASYQSMIDALTSREPGWLYLDGIDTAFHLRRLRWAMAETGRRVMVFRRAIDQIAPGWWTLHARHASISEAVHAVITAGGKGRLAALVGLDPDALAYVCSALHWIDDASLEELLATDSDPRAALLDLAQRSGRVFESEAARHELDEDPVVLTLRARSPELAPWIPLAQAASEMDDFEIAIRWLTAARRLLPDQAGPDLIASLHLLRGHAHLGAGEVASARVDLELAHAMAQAANDAMMITGSATSLARVLLEQGEPVRARERLESALNSSTQLGDDKVVAELLDMLARVLLVFGDLSGAHARLEQSLSMKRKVLGTEDHPSIAFSLAVLGGVLRARGDEAGALSCLERSLEIMERSWGPEHPTRLAASRALAELQQKTADASRLRGQLESALGLERAALGSDERPSVVDALIMAAKTSAIGGDLERAKVMLERALATQLERESPLLGAAARQQLATILVAKGDLAGAIEHLELAVALLRKVFENDDHPDVASMLRELERLRQLQAELQRSD